MPGLSQEQFMAISIRLKAVNWDKVQLASPGLFPWSSGSGSGDVFLFVRADGGGVWARAHPRRLVF